MLLLLCIRYVSCGTYVYTKSMVWGVHQELVRCRVFSMYLDYACISPFALSTYVHHAMESTTWSRSKRRTFPLFFFFMRRKIRKNLLHQKIFPEKLSFILGLSLGTNKDVLQQRSSMEQILFNRSCSLSNNIERKKICGES